jgi:hypothetical protein
MQEDQYFKNDQVSAVLRSLFKHYQVDIVFSSVWISMSRSCIPPLRHTVATI